MFGLRFPVDTTEHTSSYYAATARDGDGYATLEADIEADVAVVGGGFSGVNTALELSERGYSVALLEANRLCWGASGRNGGQIIGGIGHDADKFRKVIGEEGVRTIYGMGIECVKNGKRVQLDGWIVDAMSPAFMVDTSRFLPIYYLGDGNSEEENSAVPGYVVRHFDENVLLFPVEGRGLGKSCATGTICSEWEVRESVVRLNKKSDQIFFLKERGFYEIKPEKEHGKANPNEVVLARHQLAHTTDDLDEGRSSIFRVPETVSSSNAAKIAPTNSLPSLMSRLMSSSTEDPQSKKQNTLK